jgi:hypothetical protein
VKVDDDEKALVKELLLPDEQIEITARQRRFGPGGSMTAPTSVIGTNKRLIIVNRATLGLRKDYEVILYKQITSVRLERGIVTSSVFVRVQGYDRDKGLLADAKQEGEIDGLNIKEAAGLVDYLNKKVSLSDLPQAAATSAGSHVDNSIGAYVYCSKCGHKGHAGTKYCENCGERLA